MVGSRTSTIAAFFVAWWRDGTPRSAGHGMVAPRLASGEGIPNPFRVPAGYPGIYARTWRIFHDPFGADYIKTYIHPKARPWGYFSMPRTRRGDITPVNYIPNLTVVNMHHNVHQINHIIGIPLRPVGPSSSLAPQGAMSWVATNDVTPCGVRTVYIYPSPGSRWSPGAIHDDGPPGLREALPHFLLDGWWGAVPARLPRFLWVGSVMMRPAPRGMGW